MKLRTQALATLIMVGSFDIVSAKGDPPVAHLALCHNGVQSDVLPAWSVETEWSFGTIVIAEGDSVRLHFTNTGGQSSAELHHASQNWTWWPSNGYPWSNVFLSDTGLYTGGASNDWGYMFSFILAYDDSLPHPNNVFVELLLGGAKPSGPNHMRTDLADQGLLPLSEPYSNRGWMLPGTGGETVPPDMLDGPISWMGRAVDWVLVELREPDPPYAVVANTCGLLTTSGAIASTEGNWYVTFDVPYGFYRISVRHRNHLSAMLNWSFRASAIPGYAPLEVPSAVFGDHAISSNGALWPGNVVHTNGPEQVKYTGTNNDRDLILQRVGGTTFTNTVAGYYDEDTNLDGIVKYTGTNNDSDVILQTIGGTVPTAIRVEQLP